ncbi:hypothetical protein C8Q78DRAFT_1065935 [Trametes maxima]|nr:hypothetical protein C8Q78DRAFT_1065935 [Trametes maxima]
MAPIAAPAPPFYEPSAPPRVVPLLIVETDIAELSPNIVSTLHQDIDMSQPARWTVRVAALPPPAHVAASPPPRRQRSVSVGPASTRLRAPSKGPELRASSKPPEVQENDDVMKIPKPAGEVGRPNRGGYKLEDALQWSAARMRTFKAVINQLVDKHLDATLSLAGQSESRMRLVRSEAVERLPALEVYEQEWPVVGAVKQRLKYTSSKARQAVQDAVSKIGQPRTRRK